MVFLGSLGGSNTVSVDNLTTTGLVTTPALIIGPGTTVNEEINRFWYGRETTITGVNSSGAVLVTISVPGMVSSDSIYVTAAYTGMNSPLPSVYARVYDATANSFRVTLRVDDETPTTSITVNVYWVVMD